MKIFQKRQLVFLDFNMKGDQAKTALMLAVERGEIGVVKLFLEYAEDKKIDLNVIDRLWFTKNTALFYAVLRQQDQILDLLCQDPRIEINVRDGSSQTPFMAACDLGFPDILQVFFKYAQSRNIDLNARDQNGMTGFAMACGAGNDLAVSMLLKQVETLGIDPNIPDLLLFTLASKTKLKLLKC